MEVPSDDSDIDAMEDIDDEDNTAAQHSDDDDDEFDGDWVSDDDDVNDDESGDDDDDDDDDDAASVQSVDDDDFSDEEMSSKKKKTKTSTPPTPKKQQQQQKTMTKRQAVPTDKVPSTKREAVTDNYTPPPSPSQQSSNRPVGKIPRKKNTAPSSNGVTSSSSKKNKQATAAADSKPVAKATKRKRRDMDSGDGEQEQAAPKRNKKTATTTTGGLFQELLKERVKREQLVLPNAEFDSKAAQLMADGDEAACQSYIRSTYGDVFRGNKVRVAIRTNQIAKLVRDEYKDAVQACIDGNDSLDSQRDAVMAITASGSDQSIFNAAAERRWDTELLKKHGKATAVTPTRVLTATKPLKTAAVAMASLKVYATLAMFSVLNSGIAARSPKGHTLNAIRVKHIDSAIVSGAADKATAAMSFIERPRLINAQKSNVGFDDDYATPIIKRYLQGMHARINVESGVLELVNAHTPTGQLERKWRKLVCQFYTKHVQPYIDVDLRQPLWTTQ